MKKIILILSVFLLLAASCVAGQEINEIYIRDSATVAWSDDKIIDGVPYADDAVIQYEAVLCEKSVDINDEGNYISLGSVDATELTIDLTAYNRRERLFGVRAVVDGVAGDYAWSNDPDVCEGEKTFTLTRRGGFVPDLITGMGVF